MFNTQGSIIFERSCSAAPGSNQWDMDAGETPGGIYFLKVNGEAAGKVVLK